MVGRLKFGRAMGLSLRIVFLQKVIHQKPPPPLPFRVGSQLIPRRRGEAGAPAVGVESEEVVALTGKVVALRQPLPVKLLGTKYL